jgi:hypothetical protein
MSRGLIVTSTVWGDDLSANSPEFIYHIPSQKSSASEHSSCETRNGTSSSSSDSNMHPTSLIPQLSSSCSNHEINEKAIRLSMMHPVCCKNSGLPRQYQIHILFISDQYTHSSRNSKHQRQPRLAPFHGLAKCFTVLQVLAFLKDKNLATK